MLRALVQMALVALVVSAVPAAAQTQRMWYRGAFDGWVETRNDPQPGYYYRPSPDPIYPLNEQSYGQPIPCDKCGHSHFASQAVCPVCGKECPRGGNDVPEGTVYTQRRIPGYYYYEEQPHYRFASPMRLGGFQKYNRPYQ